MKRLPIVYEDRGSKRYWRSLTEKNNDPEYRAALAAEFPEGSSEMTPEEGEVSRRSFLTLMGASMALAGMTACHRPEEKILPYAKPPEEVIPGKPLYYATSTSLYGTAIGLLVESHEGRPTKIEGNPRHPESLGATTTHLQAVILDMYDPDRSTGPLEKGQKRTRDDVSKALRDLSAKLKGDGGKTLAILTQDHRSPTLDAALRDLKAQMPAARVVRYEPFDRSNGLEGTKLAFGRAVEPVYALDKAMVVATLDSDALANEGSPLKNARGWVANRDPEGRALNRMYAVESVHSVTGANADHRLRLKSADVAQFALALAQKVGVEGVAPAAPLSANAQKFVDALAKDLHANHGKSAVLVGNRQPAAVHAVVALINEKLGNVGATVNYVRTFDDATPSGPKALVELANAINSKQVDTVLILGGNPAFDAPADAAFAKAIASAATSIHLSTHVDETSSSCTWHIPRAHFLEAWSDLRSEDGTYSIVQPLIAPLYDGLSDAEVVRALLGDVRKPYDLVRETFGRLYGDEKAWKRALHDGYVPGSNFPAESVAPGAGAAAAAAKSLPVSAAGFEVTIHPDAHAYDGRFANNGWMQELPDAMTKLTWGSSAWLSAATAKELGVVEGDHINVVVESASVTLPVVIAPGQADKSVAVFLGQGRRVGRVATGVGVDVYPLFKSSSQYVANGNVSRASVSVEIQKTASIEKNVLSRTQEHFNMEGRPIVRETTAAQYAAEPKVIKDMTPPGPPLENLWYPQPYEGHKWGMTIDLNACIGCNACMVACQSENNVPVVGVLGVRKSREMHWLRIDRYFEGSNPDEARSVSMPMLCQQCENAPCESVCPVGATSHSPEGLNDMAYNRCIGTRYCANNCPYKVRRFNFFNYSKNFTGTQHMQLNPNVSVRSRGVMEKCTWCVQRINEARITAKKNEPDGRVKDGAIETACQQACPTRAITFGDYNDRESMVSKKAALPRAYALLAEFNFVPRLQYLGRVRNPNPELEPVVAQPAAHGGAGAGAEHPAPGGAPAGHGNPTAPHEGEHK